MIEEQYAPLGCLKLDYILDLGANAGLASIWFLHRFPDAAIVAVEPNPDNYQIISMNLAPNDERVRIVKGAVWHRPKDLTLVRRNNDADAQVREIEPGDKAQDRIMAWDIPGLMEIGDFPIVDLLKIDIEGAELELFRNGPERWLPLIRNICIELHGAECKAAFFKALEGYEYEQATSGELTICTNLRPLALQDRAESDRSYWAARIFPPGRS
jgi:FkbM family methyltransferase